jgi:methionine-rich copper-binding protein CopC
VFRHFDRSRTRAPRQPLGVLLSLLLALGSLLPAPPPAPAAAADPCAAPANPVVAENCRPGSPPSAWDLGGVDLSQIEGFATDISVAQGQTVHFKVNTVATAYRIDLFRIGYYNGNGARLVATVPNSATVKQRQPACLSEAATGLIDCGNWTETASWAVPADAVSGVYLAKLVPTDGTPGANHVPFVVRDDSRGSDLLFQTSDTTWQAYNDYGGNSLYKGSPAGRAYKVSYNRPFTTRFTDTQKSFLFNAEYPMIRFLERNGYDVSYASGVDTDRRGPAVLQTHRAFLSVGHDEYWSKQQRANVEAARDAGVHLAFFSGNEAYWKTRWENSIDGSGTPYRTLVTYKETQANAKIDPSPEWTGTWRDPRFSPPADGGRPENGLTGTMFAVQSHQGPITVSDAEGKLRFWRNTDIATLSAGQSATLGGPNSQVLGFEWDEDRANDARPAGLMRLSSTTAAVNEKLIDYGSTVAPGTATHSLTLYRHPTSRALVFGAGTIQWSWGLEAQHDRGPSTVDRRMQQATVNLLADMGSQPGTLQTDLVATAASSDATAPTSTITSPSAGATVRAGVATVVTGTAADSGGIVSAVEVSTDGGATWQRASGRESWSYSWTPDLAGTATLRSRAVDDSGNTEAAGPGVSVTVEPRLCPCTIWSSSATPSVASVNSTGSIELGLKFRADADGYVTGVRFYKGAANTGAHVGKLYSATGTLLASATFSGETASGWQQVSFAAPVAITANTTYVVSYVAPNGGYAADSFSFSSAGEENPPLHALADGVQGGNGLYSVGSSGFPTATYRSTNYWVDVVFTTTDSAPPVVTARSPSPNATGASIAAPLTVTFSESVKASSVVFQLRDAANNLVPSTLTYDDPTRTATMTPNARLDEGATYRATVSGATDNAGNVMAVSSTWTFTTATCPCSVWNDTTAPSSSFVNGQPLELGVKLRSDVDGYVTGLRFFKAPDDPGSHVGNLWTANGALLATARLPSRDTAGCPCTVFDNAAPAVASESDTQAIELGVRFRASVAGYVTGVRFYKGPSNTGTHVGKLYTSDGTLLASATFTGESATGWQRVTFATPVAVTPGTSYVASYLAPNGGYAQTQGTFYADGVRRGPLEATEDGVQGRNGLFRYGGGFPNSTWNSSNYWVDVVFAAGWYQVTFPSPVAISANTTYVASQHSGAGRYVATSGYFAGAGASNGPLRALTDGVDGPNGVFKEGASGFPNLSSGGSNYFVDAVFSQTRPNDSTPPAVVSRSPAANAAGAGFRPNVTVGFSEAVDPASVVFELRDGAGAVVPSGLSYDDATHSATLTPNAALAPATTYRASVSARDTVGNAMAAPDVWQFTTASCPCSLWSDASAPAGAFVNSRPLELGLRFRADADGYVTGLRFYKAAGDPGTHVGNLWRADGTLLASAAFSGETASGWQQVNLASPVPVVAGMTYVASYHSSAGYYGASQGYFATAETRSGPLVAPSNGAYGPNGSYREGASGFPDLGAGGSNYWVDVVFGTTPPSDTTPPTVVSRSPQSAGGASEAGLRSAVSATFSESVQPGSIAFTLRDAAGNAVAGSLSYDDATRTATLTPNDALAPGTTYSATVSASDRAGNAMAAPDSWSFSTPTCPCSLWSDAATPAVASVGDGSPIELGLRLRVESAGYIAGVRFYKGAANGGTHVGSLWASDGTLLASAQFAGETASGWQQVNFATPIPVNPGVTYVASYFAPGGGYSYDGGYFATAGREVGPIRALSGPEAGGNGVYRYGSGGFPNQSFNNANYWVDAVFVTATPPDTTPPTVVSRSPGPGATGAGLTTNVTATFSEPVDGASIVFELRDGANAVVPSSVSYDGAARTVRLAPSSPLVPGATYTARLSGATDAAGNTMAGPDSWSFSTPTCPCSLWGDASTPTTASAGDTSSIELGVKFRSSVAGYVSGARFYKGAANTGTHVASLWTSDGALLASAVFAGETASGWQQVSFATPVAIQANATYVVSYHAPQGGYAFDGGYFAGGAYQSGPLSALADAEGGNGLYRYGGGGFPSQSYGAANYWVDVVFSTTGP